MALAQQHLLVSLWVQAHLAFDITTSLHLCLGAFSVKSDERMLARAADSRGHRNRASTGRLAARHISTRDLGQVSSHVRFPSPCDSLADGVTPPLESMLARLYGQFVVVVHVDMHVSVLHGSHRLDHELIVRFLDGNRVC